MSPLPGPQHQHAHGRALLIGDFWEKLAGASIALTTAVSLCTRGGFDLVEPSVFSSELVDPEAPKALPLSTYFEREPIAAALAPRALISAAEWHARVIATPMQQRAAVLIIWSDFPRECRAAVENRTGLVRCPTSCTARARRELQAAFTRLGRGWPLACLAGAALRRSQRLAVLQRYRRVVLLNLRRHDDATPLVSGAVARRDSIMQPSGAIIHAARRFLASHGLAFGTFDAVQLRSNHVAHELYAVSSAGCPKRLASCLEQLTAVASRSTVIASDIATLLHSHQDGETHRRHAYMRHCLLPAAPMVLRWYRASGIAFNASDLLLGAGGADAGALGMVDLVLASEARALTAVDVRRPWPSAFLEWIVRRRRRRPKSRIVSMAASRTSLVRCGPRLERGAGSGTGAANP
ncbi:hypothetical protein EMIHUDRAFT_204145 [Emiliania huxleyi CCMP1516]|uniref:Uncharacterized protein n=2 Tax=Emiliania huxleyi TaxID=2903 RepID=A0A0D3JXU7_EMIH1|nr:hypothetical protein EMIHUDRAFT_204145 [Emiliania huxleyi CCMP1516]EOD28332.1 hypothetical protein EMIHUDRAFT_204145 [Emiliania huxleyi CCMP1516]|eukprot:XP_005780761.1 hypothetical protein EMIHUDRAFT_204145 [Emiliania huxleyi CCMP1516]